MKYLTLEDKYQIINIENGGERLEIRFGQEGICEKDFIYLSDHPDLRNFPYEVIRVRKEDDFLCGTLVKVPVKDDSIE